jgi:YusW-like protein
MYKKQLMICSSALTFCLALSGCGNKEEVKNPPKDAPKENNSNQANGESPYNFTSFDLDVTYKDNKTFDVDYENEKDGMEAKLIDGVKDEDLSGDDAMKQLKPIFSDLKLTAESKDDEVTKQIIDKFNLNEDFTAFDLEVQFEDGSEKEYKINP